MSSDFLVLTSSPSLSVGGSFASSTVIRAYVLLLRNYQQNSAHTNHCVVKMLHRLAHDLKMEALLFQLSLFCLFNRLLSDPASGAYKVRRHQGLGS